MIPDFLKKVNNEFIEDDGQLKMIKVEYINFEDFPYQIVKKFEVDLSVDKKAQDGLKLMRIKPDKQLEQYAICLHGGLDDLPDIDEKGKTTFEFFDCGKRGHCPGEGLVCKNMVCENGTLSPRLIKYLTYTALDMHDKDIAEAMGVKLSTIATFRKRAQGAIGVNSKSALAAFTIRKNLT
jgi:DNA-binding CsgD family transcriptional regulator